MTHKLTITPQQVRDMLPCPEGLQQLNNFARLYGEGAYCISDCVGLAYFRPDDFIWLAGQLGLDAELEEFTRECTLIYLEQLYDHFPNRHGYAVLVEYASACKVRQLTEQERFNMKQLLEDSMLSQYHRENLTESIVAARLAPLYAAICCLPPQTTPAVLTLLKKVFD